MSEPRKYRKKPVVVEVVQLIDDLRNHIGVVQWIKDGGGDAYVTPFNEYIVIETLEGPMQGSIGDYIIRGVQGEFYPCKPDIFEATYDVVRELDAVMHHHADRADAAEAEVERLRAGIEALDGPLATYAETGSTMDLVDAIHALRADAEGEGR